MIGAVFVLALTLSFSIFYKLNLIGSDTVIAELAPDASCSLHESACTLSLDDGKSITLSISPRPVPLLTKFDIQVTTELINTRGVTVDFQGTTMNMGLNRVDLKKQDSNTYKGQGVLPVCILKSMEWQAQVFVKTKDGMYIAPFIFVTTR